MNHANHRERRILCALLTTLALSAGCGVGLEEEGGRQMASGDPVRAIWINLLDDSTLEKFVPGLFPDSVRLTIMDTGTITELSQINPEKYNTEVAARQERFKSILHARFTAIENNLSNRVHLILAGHHVSRVYGLRCLDGRKDGSHCTKGAWTKLSSDDLQEIMSAHPKLAERVSHIYVLGCNTAQFEKAKKWAAPFPNLVAVTGFSSGEPGLMVAYNNLDYSYHQLADSTCFNPVQKLMDLEAGITKNYPKVPYAWYLFSRCDGQAGQACDPTSSSNPCPSGQTCVSPTLGTGDATCRKPCSSAQGCVSIPIYGAMYDSSLSDSRSAYNSSRPYFEKYFAGAPGYVDVPSDTQVAALNNGPTPRGHYNNINAFTNAVARHPNDATASDLSLRDLLESEERGRAIRLVFLHSLADGWAANNGPLVTWLSANNLLPAGKTIGTMTRQEMVQMVSAALVLQGLVPAGTSLGQMERKTAAGLLNAVSAQQKSMESFKIWQALYDLDPTIIPDPL
jgi:hypothetical protein